MKVALDLPTALDWEVRLQEPAHSLIAHTFRAVGGDVVEAEDLAAASFKHAF